ncbi:MAG TPA: LLM class flavin-dependent oxidoreductase [Thermomicrobiales bacterium]|nr:LLM class flavin-dependent oxidoreductase [Thermomicrobiales bacterium]
MARHPWVAAADNGIRFGLQLVVPDEPDALPCLLETGKWVEELGFDGIFIFDHPVSHADPWVCLSALAAVTERVRLGSAVNCAPYRHPAYLARLASDVDHLSRGRLVLGLGSGWWEAEFRSLDLPFGTPAQRQAALDETITVVEGVWGTEPFSFDGNHVRTEATRISPPLQQPRPPLMLGGSGEQRTLRQVARLADACNITEPRASSDAARFASAADAISHKLAVLRQHCEDLGRAYEEILRSHFTLNLLLAPSAEEATAKRDRVDPSTSTSPGTRRDGRSSIKAFTPEEAVAYYQSLVDAGIQYFIIQLDGRDMETIDLLATAVIPHVGR